MSKNPGRLIEHEDGRKGIAYHKNQEQRFLDEDKIICQFFKGNDMNKGVSDQLVAVKSEKLKVQGFVD